ncbi:MAG: YhjD/YihY/BrkB family envelope integrity protein [Desulfobacterales bacterium]|nr:YhjD/YihY/BrkB family envelope integrity protein [Desulfobacterales bacterium]
MFSRLIEFISVGVWRIRLTDLSKRRSFGIRLLRIVLLASRGFNKDVIHLRASALTLYSLLGIVPVVAMAFGIAKGFGFENYLQKDLLERFQGQEEVATRIIAFAHSLLEATKGGLIAGVGLIILLWTVIRVLRDIENSFNAIWGIEESRGLGRKFSDYLTILVVCPMLLTMSGSITIFISTQLATITAKFALLGYISNLIFLLLKALPLCMIWGLFTFVYIFVPNTRVRFRSGLIAGIVAGTVYQIVQWGYIHFQVGVSKYNAIYGSFAALPLFLAWLQISWIIVLIGAEIAFAHQNVDTYEFEPDSQKISLSFKRLLSLMVAHLLTRHFADGKKPVTAQEISQTLAIPIRLVRQILFELVHSGIVSEIKGADGNDLAYQPAFTIHRLTVARVLEALDERGLRSIPVTETEAFEAISTALKAFREAVDQSPANRLLKDI